MPRYSRRHDMVEVVEGPESARGFHFDTRVSDAGRDLLMRTYFVMVLGLAVTGLVSMALMSNTDLLRQAMRVYWMLIVAELIFVFAIAGWVTRMSAPVAWCVFLVYAVLNGITLTPILMLYTQASVAKVFFITSATFGVSSVFGAVTKRDLTSVGHFAMMGLIGLIIASVVAFLIPGGNPMMTFVIAVVGVIIF
ncbi:MAG: Bax inhibitor-1/YccA family protein, partial [Myxococcota bacterium]